VGLTVGDPVDSSGKRNGALSNRKGRGLWMSSRGRLCGVAPAPNFIADRSHQKEQLTICILRTPRGGTGRNK